MTIASFYKHTSGNRPEPSLRDEHTLLWQSGG